ncbi:tripartite tricarboxylate transporter substrate-binding protein [Dankookia sp. GCM10030260]|uniref:tripartite tricarboxylate transporter substrate-binding protein n=1 Tax=Dankookia sp. GCM10030260 TaxID=3273390 RepID=UPI00360E1716
MLLAIAGCAGGQDGGLPTTAPPGFSADTFSRQGLIDGATATEAGCRALADGLWVSTSTGRRECLRYAAAGTGEGRRTALVYVSGDPEGASYRFAGGTPHIDGASEHYETSPETLSAAAQTLSAAAGGTPVVLLARPGMHGSSGDHARDRHTPDEVKLIDDALTQLRRRYGIQDLALVGFSSGGAIVANLLARRNDVRCAVMASAPLDLATFYRKPDGALPDQYVMSGDLADPMRTVSAIRPGATVFVLGDRRDRSVPAAAWEAWVAAARRTGLRVHAAEVDGLDRSELGSGESHHLTAGRGLDVAQACAEGAPVERILHALGSDEPLLAARGRRLGAGEIRAALAGRSLRGNEWNPRVNVYSFWGAGGELYYLDLRRGERRIAELRWRVEGDRLCTTRHGCGEVLSDGRFLNVVKGEPPRLSVTLLEDEQGATSAAVAAPTPAPATGAVRLLVGFGLGSNTDWVARIVAEALRERLGRPVFVENLPGRATAAAAEAVARSAPDGATLGLFPASFATVRHASRGVAFDPLTDFTPLSLVATTPSVVLVAPGYPVRDLGGLAAALRAAPDTPCATPGEGSFLHLSTALLVRALGATCRAVHYAEPAQALANLAAGQVQIYVNNAPTSLMAVRAGRATALAVTSRERLATEPELPTVGETVPGFEAVGWFALLGPRGLSAGIAARLERAAAQAARDPAAARRLRVLGAEPIGSSAAELAALLRAEDAKWAGAARAAGLATE